MNGVPVAVGILSINGRQYQNQYNGVGSMDWNFGNSDQLKMRYIHNEIHANNTGSALPAFYSPQSDRALMASVSEYHNFSPVMVNELRFSYSRFDQSIHTNNALNFPGLSSFPNILIQQDLNLQLGSGLYAGTPAAQNTYNLADNMSWQFGRHTVKFGGDARRFIGPISFAQFGNGVYTYSTLSGFLLDQSPNVSGIRSFGNLNYAGDNFDAYAYLNDSWQVSPTFTLNLGVKYAYVTVPSSLQQQGFNGLASVPGLIDFHNPITQKTNFGPVVGIAWSPGFVKNTVLRAGFGMNYDTTYSAANIPSVPPGVVTTEFVSVWAIRRVRVLSRLFRLRHRSSERVYAHHHGGASAGADDDVHSRSGCALYHAMERELAAADFPSYGFGGTLPRRQSGTFAGGDPIERIQSGDRHEQSAFVLQPADAGAVELVYDNSEQFS